MFDGVSATPAAPRAPHGQSTLVPVLSETPTSSATLVQVSAAVPFPQIPDPVFTAGPLLSEAPASSLPREDLLAEIQAVRQLARRLEKRLQEWPTSNSQDGSAMGPSPSISTTNNGQLVSPASLGQVGDIFAHLERVSMSQSSLNPIYSLDLVFNIDRIQALPQAPSYTTQLGKPTQYVWLPLQAEAKVLASSYIENLSYIQHILHPPSLQATIDETYQQVGGGQVPVQPGHLVLLFSIIACATHCWDPQEDDNVEHRLFVSSAQAHAYTPLWIKSAYAVLNATQDSAAPTLETIQGIIILSFIISNLEGVSMRYRSLISNGLQLAREMGLHRIDSASNAYTATPFRVEMSRRVWWYLVATDWYNSTRLFIEITFWRTNLCCRLLAVRYGGASEGVYQAHPRHMTVNWPLNVNDVDIGPSAMPEESTASEPPDMSYFLERLRLAEVSRSIVDHSLMSEIGLSRPSYHTQVMAMDFELDQLIKNMPSFFQLASYEHVSDPSKASSIFIQAYMLNSLIFTQRIKLHITYLTSGSQNSPACAASRDICLKSAKQITRAETHLLRSRHPFVRVRLRLAAILYSIFMASIILLMDVCVHRPVSLDRELCNGDVAEALKILKCARSHSLAAAKLFDSLMQVVERYRTHHQQLPVTQMPSTSPALGSSLVGLSHGLSSASPLISNSLYSSSAHHSLHLSRNTATMSPVGVCDDTARGHISVSAMLPNILLIQGAEEMCNMSNIEWADLFSDALSSSLF
jgi:hypothetical protein